MEFILLFKGGGGRLVRAATPADLHRQGNGRAVRQILKVIARRNCAQEAGGKPWRDPPRRSSAATAAAAS